jgi:hypothetical protein
LQDCCVPTRGRRIGRRLKWQLLSVPEELTAKRHFGHKVLLDSIVRVPRPLLEELIADCHACTFSKPVSTSSHLSPRPVLHSSQRRALLTQRAQPRAPSTQHIIPSPSSCPRTSTELPTCVCPQKKLAPSHHKSTRTFPDEQKTEPHCNRIINCPANVLQHSSHLYARVFLVSLLWPVLGFQGVSAFRSIDVTSGKNCVKITPST